MKVTVGDWKPTQRERELVDEVMESGRLSYGPMSRKLEREFASIHESEFAVLSNSGTSSLQVSLQVMKELHGWEDGDEVLVPSVTFVATANIVLHNRMKPVLVDVDPLYYDMDPTLIEPAITPRTRAIIPVHLFGQPCNIGTISAVAMLNGLSVIEDSCETMFVSHRGRKVGSWGDIGNFSLYMAHLLTAGVGGISTTSNPDYAAKIRSLVNHGRDGIYISLDDDDYLTSSKLKEVISRRFHFESVGHSFRVTELEAAIALGQLDGWEEMIEKRRENAAKLTQHLEEWDDLQLPSARPHSEQAHMMYPIVYRGDKLKLTHYLEKWGIETREMLPLTNQPVYKGLFNPKDYPVASAINAHGFYIGCHQHLTEDHIEYVANIFEGYFNETLV